MPQPGVGDSVRLSRDVPELFVQCGEMGIVCSIWFSPDDAFEVELGDGGSRRRVLVRSGDLVVVELEAFAGQLNGDTRMNQRV